MRNTRVYIVSVISLAVVALIAVGIFSYVQVKRQSQQESDTNTQPSVTEIELKLQQFSSSAIEADNEFLKIEPETYVEFTSGKLPSPGQCIKGVYDDFNDSLELTSSASTNVHDTSKWTALGTADSLFTTKDGQGYFLVSGQKGKISSASAWGTQKFTDDFLYTIKIDSIAESARGYTAFKSGALSGTKRYEITLFRSPDGFSYISFSLVTTEEEGLVYINEDGNSYTDITLGSVKLNRAQLTGGLRTVIERKGNTISAYYLTNDGQKIIIGWTEDADVKPVSFYNQYSVYDTVETKIAKIDSVSLSACVN